MRNTSVIILILLLCSICHGAAATVTTFAALNTAIDDACTPIHLNAQTFTVDAGFNTIDHNCTIDNVFGSDVTIDFQDARNPIIRNATVNIVGSSGARIIFTQTQWYGVEINSTSGDTTVTFTYCDFTESNSGNGLLLDGEMDGDIYVTCNNCRAFNNKVDGFGISNDCNSPTKIAVLTLNDCSSYGNDPAHAGGGSGDGISAHEPEHYVYMNGGSCYLNHKAGVANIDGSSFFAKDASFYDNSLLTASSNVSQDAGYISLENCLFSVTGSGVTTTHLSVTGGAVGSIVNCDFNGANITNKNLITCSQGTVSIIGNNLYDLSDPDSQYGISLSAATVTGVVANNTMNNIDVLAALHLASPDITVYNNIISNCDVGIHCPTWKYDVNPLNGYNCFYNNTADFSDHSLPCSTASNDISTDPQFVDPANGDYHLRSFGWRWDSDANEWTCDDVTSRCIDAGNPGSPLADEPLTLDVDPLNRFGENIRINMGAHGGTAEASMPPYDWTLLADITNDGTVDFIDLAHLANIFGDQDDELPGDFDQDGGVDLADLDWLTHDWLLQTSWHAP